MSRSIVAIAIALLTLLPFATTSAGTIGDLTPSVRGSILIDGDAAFTRENGVRSGSGTPDDPYVISQWDIVNTDAYGIRLSGTRAHVVIEDMRFAMTYGPLAVARCEAGDGTDCGRAAVSLVDAENVTVARADIAYAAHGFHVRGAKHLVVRDVSFVVPIIAISIIDAEDVTFERIDIPAQRVDHGLYVQPRGFLLTDVDGVTVRDVRITGASTNVQAVGARHFTIEHSTFGASQFADFGIGGDSHNITLRDNVFIEQDVGFGRFSHDVRVIGNHFIGAEATLSKGYTTPGYDHRVSRILICGNAFDREDTRLWPTVNLNDADDVTIIANDITATRNALSVFRSTNVLIAANSIQSAENVIALGNLSTSRIAANALSAQANAMFLGQPTPLLATDNWWGSALGPSGDGPGDGTRLVDPNGVIQFAPWLTERPVTGPGTVDCDDASTWPQAWTRTISI